MRTKTKFVSLVAFVSFAMAVLRTVIIQYDMEKNGIENETYYLPDNAEVVVFTVAAVIFALLFVFCAVFFGRKHSVTLCRSYGAERRRAYALPFAGNGLRRRRFLHRQEHIACRQTFKGRKNNKIRRKSWRLPFAYYLSVDANTRLDPPRNARKIGHYEPSFPPVSRA